MTELKTCPFCGSKPTLSRVGNDCTKDRKVIIRCPHCRVQRTHGAIRFDMNWLEDEAIKDWNRRVEAVRHD
jgi:formate dehydrogenase maturation protein FdhE